ncbi:hypothetical protein E0H82_03700 [Acinetobacter sp. ANC 4910]|uniref:hypothetical protein n=1 Tax=Acinetobacter sp. ANC 4910 TaxID=2529850 RepID=UPI00103DF379|nr:hypothetical protein [Acinetobacter sp. ANC 4910]TCB36824.1 hypothetical protein E0H82_03700 [Acinetobacter sp. ANC 4910]
MNPLQIKTQNIFGCMLTIQFFLYFFYLKTDFYIFLGLYFAMSIPLSLSFTGQRFNVKAVFLVILTILLFSLFSISSKEYPTIVGFYNMLYGVSAFISAYALYRINNPIKYIKFVFWTYTIFIVYHFVVLGFSDTDAYNKILANSSRNYLSAIFILVMVLLALTYEKEKENIPLIYPAITFLCCVGLFGRSGIALSALFLFFCLFKQKNYKLMFASFIIIFLAIILNLNTIEILLSEKTNFTNGLSSERTIFIHEYLNHITYNLTDLFFGRKLQDCCEWIILFGNPHNSFIMGHLRYGIIHTIFSLCILLFIIFSRNINLTIFGIVILSRFSVDQLGLFTPFDLVLYYLMFLIYEYKYKRQKYSLT